MWRIVWGIWAGSRRLSVTGRMRPAIYRGRTGGATLLLAGVLMLRKTLRILSLIGLGLWAASYLHLTLVVNPGGPRFQLAEGCFLVDWTALPPESPLPVDYEKWSVGDAHSLSNMRVTYRVGWKCSGFKNLSTRWRPWISLKWRSLVAPLWIPILAYGLLIVCSRILRYRRLRRRDRVGLCLKCSYDLRGSQERCPECGAPIEKLLHRSLPSWACTVMSVGAFALLVYGLIYFGARVYVALSGRFFLLGPYVVVVAVNVTSVIAAWFGARRVHSWLGNNDPLLRTQLSGNNSCRTLRKGLTRTGRILVLMGVLSVVLLVGGSLSWSHRLRPSYWRQRDSSAQSRGGDDVKLLVDSLGSAARRGYDVTPGMMRSIVGPPDLFRSEGGRTEYIYFFADSASAAYADFVDNKLRSVGDNDADAYDLSRHKKWPGGE